MPQGLRRTDKKGSVDITEHIKYNTVNMNMRAYTKKKSGKAAAHGELNEELTQKAPPGIE